MYYFAKKRFKSFEEAIKATEEASYSLGSSDLYLFEECTIENLEEKVDEYNNNDDSYTYQYPFISFGIKSLSMYPESLREELDLFEREPNKDSDTYDLEKEYKDEMDTFVYETCTRTNTIEIRVLRDSTVDSKNGGIIGYEAIYMVGSESSIKYSSAMRSFKKHGWQCSERGWELTEEGKFEEIPKEKMDEIIKNEEESMIKGLQDRREIVSHNPKTGEPRYRFYEGQLPDTSIVCNTDENGKIKYYRMNCESEKTIELLQKYPELRYIILQLVKRNMETIENIDISKISDYNIKQIEEVKNELEIIKETAEQIHTAKTIGLGIAKNGRTETEASVLSEIYRDIEGPTIESKNASKQGH